MYRREACAGAGGAGKTEVKLETETSEGTEEAKEIEKENEAQEEIHTGVAGEGSASTDILESRGLKLEGKTKEEEEELPSAEVDTTTDILGARRCLKRNNQEKSRGAEELTGVLEPEGDEGNTSASSDTRTAGGMVSYRC